MNECLVCGADVELCQAHSNIREMYEAGKQLAKVLESALANVGYLEVEMAEEMEAALKRWKEALS